MAVAALEDKIVQRATATVLNSIYEKVFPLFGFLDCRVRCRPEGPSGARKTTNVVALTRKLLIALWRLITTGEIPDGVMLRPVA